MDGHYEAKNKPVIGFTAPGTGTGSPANVSSAIPQLNWQWRFAMIVADVFLTKCHWVTDKLADRCAENS